MRTKLKNRRVSFSSNRYAQKRFTVADGTLVASVLMLAGTSVGQDLGYSSTVGHSVESYQLGHSPLNEPAALGKLDETAPLHYAIPVGSGGFNFNAGLKLEYVDNVFLTHSNTKDDFIVVPEANVGAFFPVGQLNSFAFGIGLAYYQYLENTSLNTGLPLINPNTDLAFTLRSGDFKVRFSERFSYQQDPLYETGGQFYNLYNTALFQRYLNRIGALVTWDQNKLVMTAGYFHENLWSETSAYSYIDHASELFSADAMLATSARLTIGLEAAGSINDFFNSPDYNTWRARVGPAFRIKASDFIQIKLGGGYERIQYDSSQASSLGLTPDNTYYAYGSIEHKINEFINHSLTLSHDNELGFNAANLEASTVSYSLTWAPRRQLEITPAVAVSWYDESFGSTTANLYHEKFTYYYARISARYVLGPHWRAGASWTYNLKDSQTTPVNGYTQNQLALEVLYEF
jgi:hypothetical protein